MRRVDYRTYVLGAITLIALLNGADSSVMAGVASSVARDLSLSDSQVGVLGSAYILVYAVAVLPFGAWADTARLRGRVIAVGVSIWSLATFASGLAPNFAALLGARATVGIGEASYLPTSNSLVGDFYPREERGLALAWINGGFRIGVGLGILGGSAIAARLGWRPAFFFAGIPGLILAALALRLREPERGGAEGVAAHLKQTAAYDWHVYPELLRVPTVLAAIATVACGLFVTAGTTFWVPIFVQRHFGLSLGLAGAVTGLPLLVGGLLGTLGGGWLVDRRSRRRPSGGLEVTALAFFLGAVFTAIAFAGPSLPVFIAAYVAAVTCLAVFVPATQSIAQSVIIPIRRGTGITLALLVGNLFGNALAPAAIGFLSDAVHDLGRTLLYAGAVIALLAAAAAAAATRTIGRDAERMHAHWAELLSTPAAV